MKLKVRTDVNARRSKTDAKSERAEKAIRAAKRAEFNPSLSDAEIIEAVSDEIERGRMRRLIANFNLRFPEKNEDEFVSVVLCEVFKLKRCRAFVKKPSKIVTKLPEQLFNDVERLITTLKTITSN